MGGVDDREQLVSNDGNQMDAIEFVSKHFKASFYFIGA